MRQGRIVRAFFLNVQVGILIKVGDHWAYHGLVPIIGEPRTMQIINKYRFDA